METTPTYVYANELLGLTISEANKYVKETMVYFGYFSFTRITSVDIVQSLPQFGLYNPGKLHVYVDDDGKISKLIRLE